MYLLIELSSRKEKEQRKSLEMKFDEYGEKSSIQVSFDNVKDVIDIINQREIFSIVSVGYDNFGEIKKIILHYTEKPKEEPKKEIKTKVKKTKKEVIKEEKNVDNKVVETVQDEVQQKDEFSLDEIYLDKKQAEKIEKENEEEFNLDDDYFSFDF